MTPLITALLACNSHADPKVRLEFHPEQQGNKRWAEVSFNEYSFKSTGNQTDTEGRTRAMLDIMGQAARILDKEDPSKTTMTMRTFYIAADKSQKSRLSVSVIPNSTVATTAQDTAGALTAWTEKAIALNIDLSKLPSGVPDAVYLGCLKAVVSKAQTDAANEAISATTPPQTEPPI